MLQRTKLFDEVLVTQQRVAVSIHHLLIVRDERALVEHTKTTRCHCFLLFDSPLLLPQLAYLLLVLKVLQVVGGIIRKRVIVGVELV